MLGNEDESGIEGLRLAINDLAARVAARGGTSRPRIVRHSAEEIEVLVLDPVDPPPEGWRSEADGAIWSQPVSTASTSPSWARAGGSSATPLLVTLGRPEDGGQLYLDLEAEHHVCLTGDLDVARSIARAMVTELVLSPLAAVVQVTVAGDLGLPDLHNVERLRAFDDPERLATNLGSWARQSSEALAANGWPNPFVARGCGADHDALVPLVAVIDRPDDARRFVSQAVGHAAVAVIIVGEAVEGATEIVCTPDVIEIPQLELVCTPHRATTDDLAAIDVLLDESPDGEPAPAHVESQTVVDEGYVSAEADEPPGWWDVGGDVEDDDRELVAWASTNGGTHGEDGVGDGPLPPPAPVGVAVADGDSFKPDEEAVQQYDDPPYDVLVRVLGDIVVDGGSQPLTPKQTAVVSYITLHAPVTVDRVVDAIWSAPTGGSRRKRLANTMSDCRSVLGSQYLPVAADGHYKTGPGLTTDLDLFERRVEASAGKPPEIAVVTLRGAIDLVREQIFSYPSTEDAFAWVSLENWVSTWELKVSAVAQHLAELYLDLGRADDAVAVAHKALCVVPTHPGLTESLMRAHAANGDHLAVHRVYASLVTALDRLDLDSPDESTTKVYEELRTRTR